MPDETEPQRVVRLRREYDRIRREAQKAIIDAADAFTDAENKLSAEDYSEYMRLYRG